MNNKIKELIIKYASCKTPLNVIETKTKTSKTIILNTILNNARLERINKSIAREYLKDTPLIKILDIPLKSGLVKELPVDEYRHKKDY